MILLCGIPSEPPLARVRRRIEEAGSECVVLNQREVADADLEICVVAGRVTGRLTVRGQAYALEHVDGVYLRLMDDRFLPEVRKEPAGSPVRAHSRRVHEMLLAWTEIAPARVVNRPSAMGSNASKPYQAQLIRDSGFDVPETLITNDPDLVAEFRQRWGRLIYKSMSGVRSIIRVLDDDAAAELDRIRWCPVQFQRYVEGTDVRVHTVGTEVFATSISSDAPDYRYAERDTGRAATLEPLDLPNDVAERCTALAADLGLAVSGIDLRRTPSGRYVCFEVNPCPVFSYFESATGQEISAAIAAFLTGV
jgi:glutathione synthase/RimK-type ligase-like ATP-grasp enzyme